MGSVEDPIWLVARDGLWLQPQLRLVLLLVVRWEPAFFIGKW
jgi:hypothetical protein